MIAPLLAALVVGLFPLTENGAESATQSAMARAGQARAPDGAPGLGSGSRPEDVLRRFRRPEDEDEALIAALLRLPGRVALETASLRNLYRARGLFSLLDPREEPTLAALHARAGPFLEAPGPILAADPAHRAPWTLVFLDARFRVRCALLAGRDADVATLTRGLRLLGAHHDGWAKLTPEEVTNVAARVDLAAARLRALVHDLGALREDRDGAPEVSAADRDELERALELAPAERNARLTAMDARVRAVMERLCAVLASERLDRATADTERWLAEADRRAAEHLAQARRWDPDTPEGRGASPAVGESGPTDRRRRARAEALAGLRDAPLDPELAWRAAEVSRFVGSRVESLALYDRFLALRGIRLHEGATWNQRVLGPREERAILYLQTEGGDPLSPIR